MIEIDFHHGVLSKIALRPRHSRAPAPWRNLSLLRVTRMRDTSARRSLGEVRVLEDRHEFAEADNQPAALIGCRPLSSHEASA